uniref:Uncharacterized protein n=1 Tax=Pseudo-nitzschia australis TaxID=44445 RepID=A0A7S4ALV5_9STRA
MAPEEDPRFRKPVLTTNTIHTPLHEQPITDGMGHVELQENTEDVVNISSVHSTYSKSDIAQQMKEQKQKWDRMRRDAIRMQGHLLPEDIPLDERMSTRRQIWGPSVETREMVSRISADEQAKRWNIGVKRAQMTIATTTQRGIRNVQNALSRRLPTQPYRA